MSIVRCHEFGGKRADGKPCRRRVKDSRCPDHLEEALDELAGLKSQVLLALEEGTNSLAEACRRIGKTPVTIWRWRQVDADFDAKLRAAQENADNVRVALVEDSMFRRILKGDAAAAETIFFLKNRDPDRWKDSRDIRHAGHDGGPLVLQQVIAELPQSEIDRLYELPDDELKEELRRLANRDD